MKRERTIVNHTHHIGPRARLAESGSTESPIRNRLTLRAGQVAQPGRGGRARFRAPFALSLILLLALAAPAGAGDISTIAGGGVTYGDGGPATSAQLSSPQGVAVDIAGNIYFADYSALVVRRIDGATGVITTIAGNGGFGYSGDGGAATSATLSTPLGVAVDIAGDVYLADQLNSRVRKVDMTTGIIDTVAGNGGFTFSGDGGPATAASLSFPEGVAVDAVGDIYIADTQNFRVRKVNHVTGIISTLAGNGTAAHGGDGGPATSASLAFPRRLALDIAGNVYVLDYSTTSRVRRISHSTGNITTVAGGGASAGTSGLAVNADLGPDAADVSVDDSGNLYIAGFLRVWKVDGAGQISVVAGTGLAGFSGDGGPATSATFGGLGGIAVAGTGDLFLADNGNARLRKVAADVPMSFDIVVNLNTSQSSLNILGAVAGSLTLVSVDGRTLLVLPNLASVGADFTVVGNGDLVTLSADMLSTVGGNLSVNNNPQLATVDFTSLTSVGGNVDISGNTSATTVNVGGLTSVGGNVSVTGNTAATTVNVGGLTTAGGSVSVSGNTGATVVDVGGLTTAGGSVTVENNPSAATVDASSLTSAGGSVTIANNPSAGSIDVSSLTTAGESVTVENNPSATTINVSSLTQAGGSVIITDNPNATVTLGSSSTTTTVGGNLTVETQGATVDFSGTTVAGNVNVTGNGTTTLSAGTSAGAGSTAVTLLNAEAAMQASLPGGAFASRVGFSVEHLNPATLPLTQGVDAGNQPVNVDPVAAYRFAFAVPALNQPATLVFEIDVGALSAADRAAFLAAVNSGAATLATKGDAQGSVYQTFPVCGAGQPPGTGGCAQIVLLDAAGNVLPPGSPAPATVQFVGVTGHFSTFAVVVASPTTPPTTQPPAAPSTLVGALWVGPKVVLGFWDNATNETGFVVERAVNSGAFTTLATLGAKAGRGLVAYTDAAVTPGNSYVYRVKAVKGASGSGYSNTARVSVPAVPAAPSVVTVTAVRAGTGDQVTLNWRDNANNELGFVIQRASNAAFTSGVSTYAAGANTARFQQSVKRGVAYYYRIQANNLGGASAWVNAAPFPIVAP
jgi:hypothetical protein